LIVFLDKLVRRAISLIDRPSRNRIRLTFPYVAMVCTSSPAGPENPAGQVETPWSIFSEQNPVLMVSFQSAATRDDHAILAARHELYVQARDRHPQRWSGATRNWTPIGAVTLNPERDTVIHDAQHRRGSTTNIQIAA
jgi:hypothetical protein